MSEGYGILQNTNAQSWGPCFTAQPIFRQQQRFAPIIKQSRTSNSQNKIIQVHSFRPYKYAWGRKREMKKNLIPEKSKLFVNSNYLQRMKGVWDALRKVLSPLKISVVFKPPRTIGTILSMVKDPTPPESQRGVVYKVQRQDCQLWVDTSRRIEGAETSKNSWGFTPTS